MLGTSFTVAGGGSTGGGARRTVVDAVTVDVGAGRRSVNVSGAAATVLGVAVTLGLTLATG